MSSSHGITTSASGGDAIIGGQVFLDYDNDGIRDNTSSMSTYTSDVNVGMPILLFVCRTSTLLTSTKTFSNGIYRFNGVAPGQYFVAAQPPVGFAFSSTWSHVTFDFVRTKSAYSTAATGIDIDKENDKLHENLFERRRMRGLGTNGVINTNDKSTINPNTGRTLCFEVEEGHRSMEWSFGLFQLSDKPSKQPSMSNYPSRSPSNMPSSNASSFMPSGIPSNNESHAATNPTILIDPVNNSDVLSNTPSSQPSEASTFSSLPSASFVPSKIQTQQPSPHLPTNTASNDTSISTAPVGLNNKVSNNPSSIPTIVESSNDKESNEIGNDSLSGIGQAGIHDTLDEINNDTNNIIAITCSIVALLLLIILASLFLFRRRNGKDDDDVVANDVQGNTHNMVPRSSAPTGDDGSSGDESESLPRSLSPCYFRKVTFADNALEQEAGYSEGRECSGPHSLSNILSPAPPHFAAEAERRKVSILQGELSSLSAAIRSLPKNSQARKMLDSQLGQAEQELGAVQENLALSPHTIHAIAPPGNIGLVLDGDNRGVYIHSLDPSCPITPSLDVPNSLHIVIAVDEVDTQQMTPVEVGNVLSSRRSNERRLITLVRFPNYTAAV